MLREQPDLQLAVDTLVASAHLNGSQDNASALLVQVEQLGTANLGDTLAQLQQWPVPGPLREGQVIDGWQAEKLLSQSRQSLLYRVRDGQGRAWLLKTLPPARGQEPGAAQGLLLEEWFLRRVAGRHFPELHTASQRQHLYYVMREYPARAWRRCWPSMARCPCRSGWSWPGNCCRRSAYCTGATCCTATSSQRTCTWAVMASCACWTSAWPTARACPKTRCTSCRVRRHTLPRKRSTASRPTHARTCMPWV